MAQHLMSIPQFYCGRTIFITGASGFIGKVLIWKLLHSCSLLDTIYILLRSKKSVSTQQRRIDLLQDAIFDSFRETGRAHLLDKVVALSGDVALEDLGLNEEDKRCLVERVNIVFYGAALLKMDASLKDAINVNTEGVLRTLRILEDNKHLDAFVYVSTAYSCCNESEVQEIFYPMSIDPHDIRRLVHNLPSSVLDKITDDIISPLPNSYTFSKRVTEALLAKYDNKFPIIIARPTIVICSVNEPIPGWADSLNGPIGVAIATGKGVLRVMWVDPNKKGDMIPVDFVVNSLLILAWWNVQRQEKLSKIPIYNIAASEKRSITWREYQVQCTASALKYPFEVILWYPNYDVIEPNKLLFLIKSFFYHTLPAIFIDFLLLLFLQKRFMMRTQKKISNGLKVLSYFSTKEWRFNIDNMKAIEKEMSEEDIKTFSLDTDVSLSTLTPFATLAAKKYILKESPNNITKCRIQLKILYLVQLVIKILFFYFIIKLFLNFTRMLK